MRTTVLALTLVASLFSSSQIWSFDVWVEITVEGGSKPFVIGRTNFTSGTRLTVTIYRETTTYSELYRVKEEVTVDGGEFKSSVFSRQGEPLEPGRYTVEISQSLAEYQSGDASIEGNGEILNDRVIFCKKTIGIGGVSQYIDSPIARPTYWLSAEMKGWNKPTITGLTNLPIGTELTVYLMREGYVAHDNVRVVDLKKYRYDFRSSSFSHQPLKPGKYTIEISQPIEKFRSLNANLKEGIEILDDRVIYYKKKFNVVAWNRVSKSPWGEFKGVPFGAPVELAMDKIGGLDCPGSDDRWTCFSSSLEIGKVNAIGTIEFKNNRMVSIYMTFKSDNYEYLKEAFLKKYGKPSNSRNYVVQTGIGVKYNNQSLKWWDGRVSLELDKYTSSINEGSIYYITSDEIKRIDKEEKEKKKKAIKDL